MAFLILNGTPVPCALQAQSQNTPRLIGERATAFSGRTRSTVRGHIRTWSLVTPPIPLADARALELALASPYPLVAGGDLVDGIETPVIGQLDAVRHRKYVDGERAIIEFTLQDAEPYQPILYWLRADRALPAGMTFSRASVATLIDRTGTLQEVGPDVPRIDWSHGRPALRLEPTRTNLMPEPATLAGYIISMSGDPAAITDLGSGIADGVAVVHFERTQAVGSDRRVIPPAAFAIDTSQPHVFSVECRHLGGDPRVDYIFRGSAVNLHPNGQFYFLSRQESGAWQANGDCSILKQETLADGFERIYVLVPPTVWDGTGDEVSPQATHSWTRIGVWHYAWRRPQMERGPTASSFAVGTRALDNASAPWTHGLSSFTGYFRFVETGAADLSNATIAVWMFGDDTGNGRIHLRSSIINPTYFLTLRDSRGQSSEVQVSPGVTTALGDLVELMPQIEVSAQGVRARLIQANNGGAPVASSWTPYVQADWTPTTMRLGSFTQTQFDLLDAIVLRGADWTMDQIREVVA